MNRYEMRGKVSLSDFNRNADEVAEETALRPDQQFRQTYMRY